MTKLQGGVELVHFGCRLNVAEGETMRRLAQAAGHNHLTIIHSCAVTGEAVRQAKQAIRRARRERPEARLVVTGCAAQTQSALFEAMPEVDHILGNGEKLRAESWDELSASARVQIGALEATDRSKTPFPDGFAAHTRGFVQVQNGCDHRCTFCIIPYGRGLSRSTPIREVIERIARLVDKGVKEVVLTGVDLTSWGGDLPQNPKLGALVKAILAALPQLPRLRLSSLDCIEIDDDLWQALVEEERLMPHLHLSLQSGNDLILKRMLRRHSRAKAVAFCQTIKRARPDMALTADLIAGFPTEEESHFEDSLRLIEDCALSQVHVFGFSPRPGTPAARMPQVSGEQIKARAARLREAGALALSDHLNRQIGRIFPVLTERGGLGLTPDFSRIRVAEVAPGALVQVEVTGSNGTQLFGLALSGSRQPQAASPAAI